MVVIVSRRKTQVKSNFPSDSSSIRVLDTMLSLGENPKVYLLVHSFVHLVVCMTFADMRVVFGDLGSRFAQASDMIRDHVQRTLVQNAAMPLEGIWFAIFVAQEGGNQPYVMMSNLFPRLVRLHCTVVD